MKVTAHHPHLELDQPSTLVHMAPDYRYRPRCQECGRPGHIHAQGLRRFIRDLDLGPAQTFLHVEYRRVWCPACQQAKVEQLSFADAGQRITHRLAHYIYELCKVMTVEDVARHLELNPKTVKAVDKHFLQQEYGDTDGTGLRILAIDEIAVRKGHHYMTVVLDYETGRVVWMGEDRDKQTLDEFFAELSTDQKQAIEAVAMDMWEPYINRIQHHCPQARIVFDLFHVVKAFGQVIDRIRRDEMRKGRRQATSYLKGSRYLLLKNPENLSSGQRIRLRNLLSTNERLNAVYILKDQLKMIYRYRRRGWAKKALDQWCALAAEVDHPAMDQFIKRLRFFEYGILNHCAYAIGTSALEGVNNKIKVIKRKAYGFHDPDYFAWKVKQALPGQKSTTETG
jgi:transposase